MDTTNPPAKVNTEISDAVGNAVGSGSQTVSNVAANISDNVNNATNYVKESISSFGDSELVGSSGSFLESNTLIAKFAFLIFVLIIFMILLFYDGKSVRSAFVFIPTVWSVVSGYKSLKCSLFS